MDEATLAALEAALAASPGNTQLLAVLLRAHLEGDPEGGNRLLEQHPLPQDSAPELQILAARVRLATQQPERALNVLRGSEPEVSVWKARALLALERREEGRKLYQSAVAANPTLEDVDLATALAANVRAIESADGPRLRVIANDDTTDTELDRVLRPPQKPITFKDVGGLSKVKQQIHKRIILPFQKPSLFERFKRRVGGGILLYGPPGCGKTLLARATAGECNATFFSVAISDILDMYIGESERKLHAIFDKARSKTPSVIFFDELEALAGKRQFSREGTSSKLVSQFLAEMDGFAQNNGGVLVLGATNVPWAVDPAFRRPGRFDRVLFVPPPDGEARRSILELLLDGRPCGKLDLEKIASKTVGFTGADLQNLVETATDEAIEQSLTDEREHAIEQDALLEALKVVRPTSLEWLSTARNHARYANEGGQYDEVLDFLREHGQ